MSKNTELKAILNGLIAAVDTLYQEDHSTEDRQEATRTQDSSEYVKEYVKLLEEDHEDLRRNYNELECALRGFIDDATELVEEHARWAYRDGLDRPVNRLAQRVAWSDTLLESIEREYRERMNEI